MNNIYLYITIYRLAKVWKNTFAFSFDLTLVFTYTLIQSQNTIS